MNSTRDSELLVPWFHALVNELPEYLPEKPWRPRDPHDDIFWLEYKLFDPRMTPIEEQAKPLEALELLALVARVDWQLGKQTMEQIWPERSSDWEETLDARVTEIGMELKWSKHAPTVLTAFELLPRSAEYLQVKEILVSRLKAAGKATAPVPVRFVLRMEHNRAQAIHNMLAVFQRVATSPPHGEVSSHTENGLRIHELKLQPKKAEDLDHNSLRCLLAIAMAGVRVSLLPSLDANVAIDHPELYVLCMLRFYGLGTLCRFGADAVTLDASSGRLWMQGACLALRESPCVCSVAVSDGCHDRLNRSEKTSYRKSWLRIVYGLFSRETGDKQHLQEATIHTVGMRKPLVVAMKKILMATDPLNELSGDSSRSESIETLTASQFSLKDPSTKSTAFSVETPLSRLRVLSRLDDWTCVLLPGWGQAWVHKSSILASQTRALGASVIKSIASMSFFSMTSKSAGAVLNLLKLAGKTTRKITVRMEKVEVFGRPQLFDDWCSKLLGACPMLEELELDHYYLGNLRVFLDSYASGTCRLQRLMLASALVQFDDTVLALFRALGNKRHAASRYLRELELGATHTPSRARACKIMDTAVEMLENNNRLQRFTLNMQIHQSNTRVVVDAAMPLCDLEWTPVSGFSSPALHRKMLALLSVVPGHNVLLGNWMRWC